MNQKNKIVLAFVEKMGGIESVIEKMEELYGIRKEASLKEGYAFLESEELSAAVASDIAESLIAAQAALDLVESEMEEMDDEEAPEEEKEKEAEVEAPCDSEKPVPAPKEEEEDGEEEEEEEDSAEEKINSNESEEAEIEEEAEAEIEEEEAEAEIEEEEAEAEMEEEKVEESTSTFKSYIPGAVYSRATPADIDEDLEVPSRLTRLLR